MKASIFYAFLVMFVITFSVTILGIVKIFAIDDFYLKGLYTSLLVELVGSVILVYKNAEFFKDNSAGNAPDICGRWEGVIERGNENHPHKFVAEIVKNKYGYKVFAYTKNSTSESVCSSLIEEENGISYKLIYSWKCCRNIDKTTGKSEFYGTSVSTITINEGLKTIRDHYYSEKLTAGNIELQYVGKNIYGNFFRDNKYRLEILVSNDGEKYLGITIPKYDVLFYLECLKNIIGDTQEYEHYINNQIRRDSGRHHVTIITADEYAANDDYKIKELLTEKAEYSLDFIGLGKAQNGNDTAYYVVIKCPVIIEVRRKLGLAPRDLHVTLGFNVRDVYDSCKDETTVIT